jgi:hypothetical protein
MRVITTSSRPCPLRRMASLPQLSHGVASPKARSRCHGIMGTGIDHIVPGRMPAAVPKATFPAPAEAGIVFRG